MAILAIQTAQPTGLASVIPNVIYIETTDTYAAVTATGYLTAQKQQGFTFSNDQMALVKTSDEGPVWLKVVITYSGATVLNTVVSLVQISSPGDVTLPTIANHLIVSTDTVGTLANLTGTAINNGTIQSGLLAGGVVGAFVAYPTTTLSGFLELLPVVNSSGNFNTIISNAAAIGQTQTISIPNSGSSTANFIVSKTTGTQHITVGAFGVDAGIISSGIGTGGTAGGFVAYPATTTTGSLALTPVSNVGNFAAVISNVTGLGQASTYTMPDPVNAAARFLVGATATPFTSGNFPVASGTGGLMVDSGVAATNLQNKTNIKAATTGNIGGAGAGPITVTVAGLTTASVVVATIATSSNIVSVSKAVAGTGNFDVLFSGDPGATCTLNYVAFLAAQ